MASGKMSLVNQDLSRRCTLCQADNKQVHSDIYCMDCEAYFCEECFKFHKKVPLHLAKHVVLKNEEIDIWTKLPYKCKTHGRCFEYFCEEHSDLCCQVCVSIQHRSCEHMKYIQEDADTADFRRINIKLMQQTAEQMGAMQLQMEMLETKTRLNDISKERAEECLKEFRSRMNHMLDNFEIQANEAINVRYSNNQVSLDKMEASLEKIKADLDDLNLQLSSSQTADKVILSFISIKRGDQQMKDMEQTLSQMKTSLPQMKFSLILDPTIEEFFQNIDSIGGIEDDDARKVANSSECVDDSSSNAVGTNYANSVPIRNSTSGKQPNIPLQKTNVPKPHGRRRFRRLDDICIGTYSVGKIHDDCYDDHDDDYDDYTRNDGGDRIDDYAHYINARYCKLKPHKTNK